MLACLRIRNLVLVDALDIELGSGLVVITGETGAGKSILVDALVLALGGRAQGDLVRAGAEAAEIEALFEPADEEDTARRLVAAGFEPATEILVRRVLQANGRSRTYVNGRLATLAQVTELTRGLIDLCSQHEHQSLLEPSAHLELLDAYAGLATERAEMETSYGHLATTRAALAEAQAQLRSRVEREDLLRYQVQEIDRVAPGAEDEAGLREEVERLRHADKLEALARGAEQALSEDDNAVVSALARVVTQVRAAASIDARLTEFASQLEGAQIQVDDVARELARYAERVAADPARLAEREERFHAIERLRRKYGGSVAAVVEHRARAGSELELLERSEARLQELEADVRTVEKAALEIARKLHQSRVAHGAELGEAITRALRGLGMAEATLDVVVEGRAADAGIEDLNARGIDSVCLSIAPNRGEPARPLQRIASGGELSRTMLAIKRVAVDAGGATTYVFDEIDAGVGGAVADVVGENLREIAKCRQVLVVTHLPQVAAHADAHLRVEKSVSGGRTSSTARPLGASERVEEIARMLGGREVTTKTRAAAEELIARRSTMRRHREAPASRRTFRGREPMRGRPRRPRSQ